MWWIVEHRITGSDEESSYIFIFKYLWGLRDLTRQYWNGIVRGKFSWQKGNFPIAEMGPTPLKSVQNSWELQYWTFWEFQKPILFKIKFRNFFISENFFDFDLESRFFEFWKIKNQKCAKLLRASILDFFEISKAYFV